MRKRNAFLVALGIHAIAWLTVLGHKLSLNPATRPTLFGLNIPFELSMVLWLIQGALIVITLVSMVMIALRGLATWLTVDPVAPPGICARCGYDMRASKIQCPECGYVVERISTETGSTQLRGREL